MSVLLAHEKKNTNNAASAVKALPGDDSDSESDDMNDVKNENETGIMFVMKPRLFLFTFWF